MSTVPANGVIATSQPGVRLPRASSRIADTRHAAWSETSPTTLKPVG